MVKKDIKKHNLKLDAPHLILEWNYGKNVVLPEVIYKSSRFKVWWICSKGHEWEASIHARVFSNHGCPYCSNKLACSDNCLSAIHPEVAKEWNHEKNELKPIDVLPHTKKKVWWKCENGHEWRAWIGDRVGGTKCTQCTYGYTVRERDTIHSEDGLQKLCKVCNEWIDLSEFRIRGNNQKGYWENNVCKKCDAKLVKDYRLTDIGIAAEIVRRTKHTSKKESLPFDLDKDWVLDRLNKFEWKCELTELPLQRKRDSLDYKRTGFQWNSISIDRVIPINGYIKNNVRFILNQINVFRQDGGDERMYMLAEILLKNRKDKNE